MISDRGKASGAFIAAQRTDSVRSPLALVVGK
jgi:hypothetical protein